jgi:hypothetical protein
MTDCISSLTFCEGQEKIKQQTFFHVRSRDQRTAATTFGNNLLEIQLRTEEHLYVNTWNVKTVSIREKDQNQNYHESVMRHTSFFSFMKD